MVLFWFLWILANTSNLFSKLFCEYVFKIFIKRIDHFAACNLFSSWICVQDEDLHCCSCIYLSANSLSNGNVQRCSRCKARRYLVMALCTAVIGLADWTHLIINFLICRRSKQDLFRQLGVPSGTNHGISWWCKNNLQVDPMQFSPLCREQWTL